MNDSPEDAAAGGVGLVLSFLFVTFLFAVSDCSCGGSSASYEGSSYTAPSKEYCDTLAAVVMSDCRKYGEPYCTRATNDLLNGRCGAYR